MLSGVMFSVCLLTKMGGRQPEGDLSILDMAKLARRSVFDSLSKDYHPQKTGRLRPAGAFVTIEKDGVVYGCRGYLTSPHPTLEQTVDAAAHLAARKDPRYGPVRLGASDRWRVTVTIVDALKPCQNVVELQPSEGLVLTQGTKIGVVLPFEGRDPKARLKWAYTKAGAKYMSSAKLQILIGRRCRL